MDKVDKDINPTKVAYSTWMHLIGICGVILFPLNILIPLIMWCGVHKDSAFADSNGREVIRFQLMTTVFYHVIIIVFSIALAIGFGIFFTSETHSDPETSFGLVMLILFLIPYFFLNGALFVFWLWCAIKAAVYTAQRKEYAYPLVFSPRRRIYMKLRKSTKSISSTT